MEKKVRAGFLATAELTTLFVNQNAALIVKVAEKIADSINKGKKLIIWGNGGSAADAQHLAAEFVNRFLVERRPLPAIALTTDSSILTAIGNDYGFEYVFLKQVIALGNKGDVAMGISTSGNSPNVLLAIKEARRLGLITIGLTGNGGGKLRDEVDFLLDVPSHETPRIQEVHLIIEHFICELVDDILFPNKKHG